MHLRINKDLFQLILKNGTRGASPDNKKCRLLTFECVVLLNHKIIHTTSSHLFADLWILEQVCNRSKLCQESTVSSCV